MSAADVPSSLETERVVRTVVTAQLLFTAGNVLTTGGFLYYYANTAFPTTTAFQFALLLALPELMESAGVFARPVIGRLGGRKRTWLICFLMARVFALGVPVTAVPLILHGRSWPFGVLVVLVGAWYVLQGLAYVAYISWLSDLVPEQRWGDLFARRRMASLAIMLLLPIIAGALKHAWDESTSGDDQLIGYVAVFLTGTILLLASAIPLLQLPEVELQNKDVVSMRRALSRIQEAFANPSFRWLLFHSWWLSFFQGLTQAAFFRYRVNVLDVSLTMFYVLSGLMLLLQVPCTWQAGRLSDSGRDKATLFWSVTAVSGALLFWLAATPERWWILFAAYAVWGVFGFVNICGRNLALKIAPASDNATHYSLFRQIGGLFTACAGLLGGIWLDALLRSSAEWSLGGHSVGAFQVIFLVSFGGRATAGIFLLPIRRSQRGT